MLLIQVVDLLDLRHSLWRIETVAVSIITSLTRVLASLAGRVHDDRRTPLLDQALILGLLDPNDRTIGQCLLRAASL